MIILEIIFWILLLDSVIANIIAWTPKYRKYFNKFNLFKKYFPITRGWTAWYLILVLFIGYLIF